MGTLKAEFIRALHILALDAVECSDYESWYRSICRWYSREFHTPLKEVLEYSDEFVVKTYFEDNLWRTKNSDTDRAEEIYEDLKYRITTPPEELAELEEEDDEWADEMIAQINEELKEKGLLKDENKIPTKEQQSSGTTREEADQLAKLDPNLKDGEQYTISGEGIDFIPEDDLE